MFARVSKQFFTGVRRFSHESESQLETWIKINKDMHFEAAKKAEEAVSGTKIEVAVLRTEVNSLKNDVNQVKSDLAAFRTEVKSEINDLRKGQVEIHKEISRLHDQSSNQTRLILAGGAAIASAFFAANQYVEHLRHKDTAPTVVK